MFTINLDLPPRERFVEVTSHLKDEALSVLNKYLDYIPSALVSIVSYSDWIPRLSHEEYY